jgi:ATP-dependent Clp protease adaptor protein ClpS
MLNVHENGMGVAGVYVKSIAETKVDTVHKRAQEHGYPLRCSLEPE